MTWTLPRAENDAKINDLLEGVKLKDIAINQTTIEIDELNRENNLS